MTQIVSSKHTLMKPALSLPALFLSTIKKLSSPPASFKTPRNSNFVVRGFHSENHKQNYSEFSWRQSKIVQVEQKIKIVIKKIKIFVQKIVLH